jgi:hypothetical protein
MMQRIPALAVVLIAGLFAFAARAEDYVVIESSAPAIKVGTELSATNDLDVPASARVVLLRADGKIVTVNGPAQGIPAATPAGAADNMAFVAIRSLVRLPTQGAQVGAVRAADPDWRTAQSKTVRDILAIDTTEGGDTCLYDLAAAELIRNPAGKGTVTILSTAGAASATLVWPAGDARMPWPKDVPLADGASYLIQEDGHSGAAMTTVHVLSGGQARADMQRIAQLAEHGCTSQARLWLRMITAAAEAQK